MALEKSHKEVVKYITENKESIHVLKAELTHLNDPVRLQKLATTHLGFSTLKPFQIVAINELPKQKTEVKVAVMPDINRPFAPLPRNKLFMNVIERREDIDKIIEKVQQVLGRSQAAKQ